MIKINDELYRSVDIHKFIDLKYSDSENIDGINARLKADVIDDIKTFEKNGFCIDVIDNDEKCFISSFNDIMLKLNKDLPKNFKLSDHYKEALKWTDIDGKNHSFIHIKPDAFSFEYVDSNNISDVIPVPGIFYINTFYGICIKSKLMKICTLAQIDFVNNCYRISEFNIIDDVFYGASRNRLLYFHDQFSLTGTNHCGAIFEDWNDFVNSNQHSYNFNIKLAKDKIVALQEYVSYLENEQIKKNNVFKSILYMENNYEDTK